MPAPRENTIPDSENWKFIQRFPDVVTELKPLARNLVAFDNQVYEHSKAQILSFLEGSDDDKAGAWSALWITIIQTWGLGYITSQDNLLHTTALAKYLAETEDPIEGFFNYWALRFQLPFAQTKHREWKELGKVVQPIVFVLQHLVTIYEKSLKRNEPAFSQTYLTYEEVVLVLMKSKESDIYAVFNNVNLILRNRQAGFDYTTLREQGYSTVEDHFANRARRYFESTGFIRFDSTNRKVLLNSWTQLLNTLTFLSYAKKPIRVNIDERTRINLFDKAFNNLEPHPTHLFMAITTAGEGNEADTTNLNLPKLVHANLSARGYSYQEDFIEAFLLSLKTKPFLILSGISGTGKTALPKAIMSMIGNDHCKPIAVAPDWTDNTDMLGYFNVENQFIIGEFTILVREAVQNRETPYFVILDEMNLARVEYYFAQVLSVIESRKFVPDVNDVEYEDFLFNEAMRDRLIEAGKSDIANLRIPSNLYIIGTVNIDETTHPFSKKVLDRANVLEINNINLMQGVQANGTTQTSASSIPSLNYFYKGDITNLTELQKHWSLNDEVALPMTETLILWINKLSDFNDILKASKMNFGFRVRDEVCIYLYHAATITEHPRPEHWWHKYFDQQLVQKILTRFSGEQYQVEEHIVKLFNLCLKEGAYNQDQVLTADLKEDANISFPKAANKLQLMLKEVVDEERPSTSFWTV
jgi:hypothetical protein